MRVRAIHLLGMFIWVIAVSVCLNTTLFAADWPTYQQNNQRNAKIEDRFDAQKLGIAWRKTSAYPPNPAWAGPAKWDAWRSLPGLKSMRNYDPCYHVVAAGGKAYTVSSTDDSVHCLEIASGKELWSFTTGGPVRLPPSIVGDKLYLGSDDGYAYCLGTDGSLIWKVSPSPESERRVISNGRIISRSPVRSGVLVEDGIAYFAASLLPWHPSYLCAVNADTGKVTNADHHYVKEVNGLTLEGALASAPDKLVVPQGRVAPQLIEKKTGNGVGSLGGGGGSFVVVTPESVFHGPGNKTGWLTSSKVGDRSPIATYPQGNALVMANDIAYMLTDDKLIASDVKARKNLWNTTAAYPYAMILVGDTLFAGGNDEVAAFDAKTGKKIWAAPVDGKAHGLSSADSSLFVSTDTGEITCFRVGGKPIKGVFVPADVAAETPDKVPAGLKEIERFDDKSLTGQWAFQLPHAREDRVKDLAGHGFAMLTTNRTLQEVGEYQALHCDSGTEVMVASKGADYPMPEKTFSVEAWVRLDATQAWGAMFSAIQDNGSYEKGLLLGYQNDKFCFAVASKGKGKLTYMQAKDALTKGKWYHVAGTYDGETMRLYVDGELQAESKEQSGEIDYAPAYYVTLAKYKDDNEDYPLLGMLHEVRLWERTLTPEEIVAHAKSKEFVNAASAETAGHEPLVGPWLKFTAPGVGEFCYKTKDRQPSILKLYEEGQEPRIIRTEELTTDHCVVVEDLKLNRNYRYRVGILDSKLAGDREAEDSIVWSESQLCDTFFNYNLPHPFNAKSSGAAEPVISNTQWQNGMAVVLNCEKGGVANDLAAATNLRVIAVTTPDLLAKLRTEWIKTGNYGPRLSAVSSNDLSTLPACFANVIAVDGHADKLVDNLAATDLLVLLRPQGGEAIFTFAEKSEAEAKDWLAGLAADQFETTFQAGDDGLLCKVTRKALPGSADWSHMYGSAANNAFAGEDLAGAKSTADLDVQWVGRPGPRYHADRQGRKNSPLSTDGRLYIQGLQRMIVLDAYNGIVLWAMEVPEFIRFNIPRDTSNWCADEDAVFAAVGHQCWQLDAKTGELLRTFDVPATQLAAEPTDVSQPMNWGYIARSGDMLLGSETHRDAQHTLWWGEEGWYDKSSGNAIQKVLSDKLFGYELGSSRNPAWKYEDGVILNATITADAGKLYFVESRNKALKDGEVRRLESEELWKEQYLVSVDSKTGAKLWEQKVELPRSEVMLNMAIGEGKVYLVGSSSKTFHITTFDQADGKADWSTKSGWQSGDHGGHMSRPLVVGGKLYVRPGVYDAKSGEKLAISLPGGGCGTYAASSSALFFRSGEVSMWNTDDGSMSKLTRVRPDCWLSTIPAGGMLLSPEGGGGCSCGSWLETSFGFLPKAFTKAESVKK